MKFNRLLTSFALGALVALIGPIASGCAKSQTCDDLTARLCVDHADRCDEAGPWVRSQHPALTEADRPAADAACAAILASDTTFAAYTLRFANARVRPTAPAPAPAVVAPPAKRDKTPAEIAEEVGETAEEAGKALDKIEKALERD